MRRIRLFPLFFCLNRKPYTRWSEVPKARGWQSETRPRRSEEKAERGTGRRAAKGGREGRRKDGEGTASRAVKRMERKDGRKDGEGTARRAVKGRTGREGRRKHEGKDGEKERRKKGRREGTKARKEQVLTKNKFLSPPFRQKQEPVLYSR